MPTQLPTGWEEKTIAENTIYQYVSGNITLTSSVIPQLYSSPIEYVKFINSEKKECCVIPSENLAFTLPEEFEQLTKTFLKQALLTGGHGNKVKQSALLDKLVEDSYQPFTKLIEQ